jgi:serine/threonine protein kinase
VQVEQELAILQQLHHPHLVSFIFIADQGSRISIVMDWAGENLRVHRTVTQSQQYTEDVARYMMYQLTSALVYLHAKVGICGSLQFSGSAQWFGSAVSRGIALVSTSWQLRWSTHPECSSRAGRWSAQQPMQN